MNRDALNALDQIVALARGRAGTRVPVVGIAGPQGSGKTTLVRAYDSMHPNVACFSLDDVYLGKAERQALARDLHPLFATRGPPGTHDMNLFDATVRALQTAGPESQTPVPAFDKVADDRVKQAHWPVFEGRPGLILIDGWCMGARTQSPEELAAPVNSLEAEEDPRGNWRTSVNDFLDRPYQASFGLLDAILNLRAPLFSIVLDWRSQQEESLLGHALAAAERDRIARFIAHYERITKAMMAGHRRADIEVQLDRRRNVTEVRRIPT